MLLLQLSGMCGGESRVWPRSAQVAFDDRRRWSGAGALRRAKPKSLLVASQTGVPCSTPHVRRTRVCKLSPSDFLHDVHDPPLPQLFSASSETHAPICSSCPSHSASCSTKCYRSAFSSKFSLAAAERFFRCRAIDHRQVSQPTMDNSLRRSHIFL